MKMRVILVDDEKDSLNVLRNLLKKFCPDVTIVAEAGDIDEAFELITVMQPDAIFLDVQMPGGSGFRLLKKFSEITFGVVFVTSYDMYALDAIKLSALHYLLKPVEVEDLKESIKRIEKSARGRILQRLEIQNAISNLEGVEKKIAVHTKDHVVLLKLNDITHFESDRNYTIIFTSKGVRYTSSKNLGEFEEMLKEQTCFFRVNKSCLVNLNYVKYYSAEDSTMITVNKVYGYEVSRRKRQEIIEFMKEKRS